MRLWNRSMSFWSHLSLFRTLRDFPPKLFPPESNSWYPSSVLSISLRTLRHPCAIPANSIFCSLVSSRLGTTTSTSWRTMARLRTLLNRSISIRKLIARWTHSSDIALNWSGASINCWRIWFASWSTVMKSPILKPKLIVTLNGALSLPHKRKVS